MTPEEKAIALRIGESSAMMDEKKIDKLLDAIGLLSKHCDAVDCRIDAIDPEKVRALYERAGTPGEKTAALAALTRMGIDPNKPKNSISGAKEEIKNRHSAMWEDMKRRREAGEGQGNAYQSWKK